MSRQNIERNSLIFKTENLNTFLQINNLTKKYGPITAVNDLSFKIEEGNIYGILGPNGSGKSTTLGMVLNVVNPTSGNFQWFDGNITTHDALKQIGAIIENPNFYPYMTAVQNLELVCRIKGIPFSKVEEKLKIVGLFERKDSKFKTFSLGMKQRLAIASALLNDPKVLILDEPTNGLDPQGIHQVREIIQKIAQNGTTILMASHLLYEVEKICSHVIILQKGKKLYEGSVEALSADHGYFELKAEGNTEKLIEFLESHHYFSKTKTDPKTGIITAFPNQNLEASDINRILFNENIVLSHLIKRKSSLEKRFLEITENTKNQ